MADEKKTKLSIVIRAVDQATAKIKAINERLDAVTKPVRDFKKALGEMREKSGLDDVVDGFKGVGGAVKDLLGKLLAIGGIAAAAVYGLKTIIDEFDNLGDTADRVGFAVDALAQLRYAAQRSGVETQRLDRGLENFSKMLGQVKAGTGGLKAFLDKVSPALGRQLKHAKSNEEAFNLLAAAMVKLKDPAKRAALAQQAFGDASLATLVGRGPKAIQELRDRYAELAGPQAGAAAAAGDFGDSMDDLKATTDGVKAALVEGLAPALTDIVKQLREWLQGHRADIKEWAASLGKKLPGAFEKLKGALSTVIDVIKPFVDEGWKLKVLAVALAAVILGPLISSIVSLGIAIMTTPVGWIVGGIALIAAGAYELIKHWDAVSDFFVGLWDGVKSAFGAAWDFIADGVNNVLGAAAGAVMAVWQPVADFFGDLWDRVKSVFQSAWEYVRPIVDKIIWAANKVKEGVEALTGSVDASAAIEQLRARAAARGDVTPQTSSIAESVRAGSSSAAKVTVDFANAPRGLRVKADPQSTADVDLSVGYNMIPGTP